MADLPWSACLHRLRTLGFGLATRTMASYIQPESLGMPYNTWVPVLWSRHEVAVRSFRKSFIISILISRPPQTTVAPPTWRRREALSGGVWAARAGATLGCFSRGAPL